MSDIFISYTGEDLSRIRPLIRLLEERGWSVWWDRNILPGRIFAKVIEEEIGAARCIIVVWSENSAESLWVRTEATQGQARNNLIPVLIDDVKIPFEFSLIQAARLVGWDGESSNIELENLLKAVSMTLARSQVAGVDDTSSDLSQSRPEVNAANVERYLQMVPRPAIIDRYYWTPPIDVDIVSGGYVVQIDVPGLAADEVRITVQSSALIVSGVRRVRRHVDLQESLFRERKGSRFYRKIIFPEDLSGKRFSQDYSDGVLILRIED